jgi:hypothetical protein
MSLCPHLVEKRIQAAQERGEFDGLPGLGQPIPDLDAPYDEHWWVRQWMQREGLNPAQELRDEGVSPSLAALLAEVKDRRSERC